MVEKKVEGQMIKLLTRKEVQELLHISEAGVIRMERKGDLKPIKLSHKKVLYDLRDIEEMLERKKIDKSKKKEQKKDV